MLSIIVSQSHATLTTIYLSPSLPQHCIIPYDVVSNTYYIIWNYTVLGEAGRQIDSGEGRMGLGDYDTQHEAEQIVKQYGNGVAHSCWYSPVAFLTKARFTLSDIATNTAIAVWIWFLGTALILVLMGICFVRVIWYPWRTYKYGLNAVGTVI